MSAPGEEKSEVVDPADREIWETTFDAVPDLISIIDTTHTITRVNRAMAEFCGVPREELIGRKCYEIMHGTAEPLEACPHSKSMLSNTVQVQRVEEPHLDRIFDVTTSPIVNSSGTLVSCVHHVRDLTVRVKADIYRKMGQEILRLLNQDGTLSEVMQQMVAVIKEATGADAVGIRLEEEGDFPYFHQEGFPLQFLSKENSLQSRRRDGGVCRDEDGSICLECTCGLVITGTGDPAAEYFTAGGSFWTNDSLPLLEIPAEEDPRTNPRNECVHLGYASVALVPIRAKGRIVGLIQLNQFRKGAFTKEAIEILEDVGKSVGEAMLRKQAEEKLVRSKAFLRKLADQLPGLVAYWTADLRCIFTNEGHDRRYGRSQEEMSRLSVQEFLGELYAGAEANIAGALRGERQNIERTYVDEQGEKRHIWSQYIPDIDHGTVQGFFVYVSDITDIKRAEEEKGKLEEQFQQMQKLESVGRLAGGVAHDFNNMLGVILGHAELAMIKVDRAASPLHDLIEIRNAAERSANLTRQLLTFARKQDIAPTITDLNEKVADVLEMLQRLLGEEIHLFWHPAPNLWPVKADHTQLDQILANLCVNARDAMEGTGVISIRTENGILDESYCSRHPDVVPGEYVRLIVSDDGCGMDSETLQRIFEPFFTTKEVGKGTGLGLSTVFGIVKQNGGCIAVESAPGEGTTFSIYLPRHCEAVTEAAGEEVEAPVPTGKETILLVEDEALILEMTAAMLEQQGYTVLAAETPEEAIELAQKHGGTIDLVLTDVIMPLMNGTDLAKTIREGRPSTRCLYMSGYTADVITGHGELDEKVGFLQKPFTFPVLAAKVRDVLDAPPPRTLVA